VEIGAEAAIFPEKEYISGIFFAVWWQKPMVSEPGSQLYELYSGRNQWYQMNKPRGGTEQPILFSVRKILASVMKAAGLR
jgi:hypothetical protein